MLLGLLFRGQTQCYKGLFYALAAGTFLITSIFDIFRAEFNCKIRGGKFAVLLFTTVMVSVIKYYQITSLRGFDLK